MAQPARTRRRSLRTVLTVWNAVILAVMLAAFGLVILFVNQSRIRADIDEDLVRQATNAVRGGGPPPPPRFGPGGPDDLDRGPPGPGGDGPPDADGPPGRPNPYAAASRIADVRRPRFFNVDGRPLHARDNPSPFDAVALRAALAGHSGFSDVTLDGQDIRVYSRPMGRGGRIDGAAQFAREQADAQLLWAAQLGTLLVVLPLAVIAAAAAAYFVTGRTLRPVARLTQTASQIGLSGDLKQRLEVVGNDEIADLARTFNGMLDRLQTSFEDLQAAFGRLEGAYEQQRRFAADASHELRTPLTRLRLATSAALAGPAEADDLRHALATADRAAEAMTNLVSQLLTLARADAGQLGLRMEPTDLRVVVAEGLEQVPTEREITPVFPDRPILTEADPDLLRRVIVNLVQNSLRHTPASGTVTVETGGDNREAWIEVRDTGEGIAPEHLAHLGERFYRVDAARNRRDGGAGLGLAICGNIVRAHRGKLEFASVVGQGTTVRATFPALSKKVEMAGRTK